MTEAAGQPETRRTTYAYDASDNRIGQNDWQLATSSYDLD